MVKVTTLLTSTVETFGVLVTCRSAPELVTVTVKLQLVLLPQVSLAVASTVVVPIGNVVPLGGLALTNGGGEQPPHAVTV